MKKKSKYGNDIVNDFLEEEYPGQDICQDCDFEIQLAQSLAAQDALTKSAPGTALKKMCKLYGLETPSSS